MQFRILGPLEVLEQDVPQPLGGAKQRAVLAILILHRGELLSGERLADELWGERPPATAAKTLQGYISRLRKTLGEDLLRTRGRGYVLTLPSGQLDLDEFERLAEEGRNALSAGDADTAAERLRGALDPWRGPPLADFTYEPFAQAEIARLEEARLASLEDRIEADLVVGRPTPAFLCGAVGLRRTACARTGRAAHARGRVQPTVVLAMTTAVGIESAR
ncbi:MAG: AfsR/SARP family transcriptional regulator [Solirubrobacteraceae bacterium]